MGNKQGDSHFGALPQPAPAEPQAHAEARGLVDRLLDGGLAQPDHARLETLVVEDPAVAALYVEMVHLWCNLPLHLPRSRFDFDASEFENDLTGASSMNEALILPAIREAAGEADGPFALPATALIEKQLPAKKGFGAWWWRSAAAVLALAAVLAWATRASRPAQRLAKVPAAVIAAGAVPPPVALVVATAGMNADDAAPAPGTRLPIGQRCAFGRGALEVRFDSGAVAVIHGPARFRVIGQNALALEDGSLAAHVPVAARGFRVDGPGLSVVDRGTNFGVWADAGKSTSEVHVFEGIVDATGVDAAGRPTALTVRAFAGQALSHNVDVAPLAAIPCAPEHFVREIAATRIPVALHNTGEHVAPGAADPNWIVVTVPGAPARPAGPARVIRNLDPIYAANTDDAKWIGVNAVLDGQPSGAFVFRTTVDLSDVDPASLRVSAAVAADDCVADIRVNGVRTGASNSPDNAGSVFISTAIELPATPWKPGLNQVDVEVLNRPNKNWANSLVLQIRWTATALARVHRWEPMPR